METCGKCRHFIREKLTDKEICEAWQQPTHMKRQACYSYIPKKLKLNISEMINNNAIFVCFGQEHVLHFYTFFQMNIFRQM